MPQDPPASSGGGAIYKEGEPVSVSLNNNENFSPPTGETWVVTISASNADVGLDGNALVPAGETAQHVLTSDDVIQAGSNSDGHGALTGWSI